MSAVPSTMSPAGEERLGSGDHRAGRQTPLRWPRAVLALAAGVILAAALVVIGAPSWLSACVGVLAGIRVVGLRAGRPLAPKRR